MLVFFPISESALSSKLASPKDWKKKKKHIDLALFFVRSLDDIFFYAIFHSSDSRCLFCRAFIFDGYWFSSAFRCDWFSDSTRTLSFDSRHKTKKKKKRIKNRTENGNQIINRNFSNVEFAAKRKSLFMRHLFSFLPVSQGRIFLIIAHAKCMQYVVTHSSNSDNEESARAPDDGGTYANLMCAVCAKQQKENKKKHYFSIIFCISKQFFWPISTLDEFTDHSTLGARARN